MHLWHRLKGRSNIEHYIRIEPGSKSKELEPRSKCKELDVLSLKPRSVLKQTKYVGFICVSTETVAKWPSSKVCRE